MAKTSPNIRKTFTQVLNHLSQRIDKKRTKKFKDSDTRRQDIKNVTINKSIYNFYGHTFQKKPPFFPQQLKLYIYVRTCKYRIEKPIK